MESQYGRWGSEAFDIEVDFQHTAEIRQLFSDVLLILAEANLRIGAYHHAIKYATHFLKLDYTRDAGKINALYFRSRAYAAMEDYRKALVSYDVIARKLTKAEKTREESHQVGRMAGIL